MQIEYNPLNLPKRMTTESGNSVFQYTIGGEKISKITLGTDPEDSEDRVYLGGIEYKNDIAQFYSFGDGRLLLANEEDPNFEPHPQYTIADHLGNTVVLFEDRDGDGLIVKEEEADEESPTEVLQRNHYYPFGLAQEGTWNASTDPEMNYLYNGKELDIASDWSFYGFRMYDAAIGRFTGVDPLAEKYSSLSPYAYVANNPLSFIDPDGRDIIPVHGTWSNVKTWKNLGEITKASNNLFRDNQLGASYSWSGDNFSGARTKAATGLIDHVRTQMKSEKFNGSITLVGHSHGGNVSIEALNMMAEMKEFDDIEFNLLTINTPVRDDYQLSEKASDRVNHVNVYDKLDPVQSNGGDSFMNKLLGVYSKGARTGKRIGQEKGSGELGDAGREFDNAEQNISVDKPQGPLGDFHNSHNRTKDWIDKTENK